MEEEISDSGMKRIVIGLIAVATLYLSIHTWASFESASFGLTPPELLVEVGAITLLIIIGLGGLVALGLFIRRPAVRIVPQIAVIAAVIMLSANHLAISKETASLKHEFGKVVATACHTDDGRLVCGSAYKAFQKKLAERFDEEGIIPIGRWEPETHGQSDNLELHRSTFYLTNPFVLLADNLPLLSRL